MIDRLARGSTSHFSTFESHPARLVNLLLVVQDGVLPWKVEELQDNGQPSEQDLDMMIIFQIKCRFRILEPSGMEDKLLVIDDHAPVCSNLFALRIHIFHLHSLG